MKLSHVLNSLSASLVQQDWTVEALELHLSQRLPSKLAKLAHPMALALKQSFPKGVAPDAAIVARTMAHFPQTKRIWKHVLKTGAVPQIPLAPPGFTPNPTIAHISLPKLTTTDALADWLSISTDALIRFADLRCLSALSDNAFGPHYRHHLLPKRDGSLRLIEEPKPMLKRLQRQILKGLINHIPPHEAAFGYRKGRNCIQGAARHAGEAVVLGFDLSGFFPSIAFNRAYGIFRTVGYPEGIARSLAGLCTSITPSALLATPGLAARDKLAQRHLPQGAPTSPALANLAAFSLDRRLTGLARSLGANYSRYADDMAFSGDSRIAPILLRAVPQIIREEGFYPNAAKARLARAHDRQTVTGLVINRHVNFNRSDFDLLKATLHHLADPSDPRRVDPHFLRHLAGRIGWVEQINPARGLRLRQLFDQCFHREPFVG